MPYDDLDEMLTVQGLIAALPLPTLIVGQAEKVVILNDAAEMLLGKNLTGRHFTTALRHPKLVEAVERSLLDRAARKVSFQIVEHGRDMSYEVDMHAIAGTGLLLLSFQNATDIAQAE